LSKNNIEYYKSYPKLDGLLAYMGGFAKITMLIIGMVKVYYSFIGILVNNYN